MVSIAQLAERQIVVLDVAGSSPVIHLGSINPMFGLLRGRVASSVGRASDF